MDNRQEGAYLLHHTVLNIQCIFIQNFGKEQLMTSWPISKWHNKINGSDYFWLYFKCKKYFANISLPPFLLKTPWPISFTVDSLPHKLALKLAFYNSSSSRITNVSPYPIIACESIGNIQQSFTCPLQHWFFQNSHSQTHWPQNYQPISDDDVNTFSLAKTTILANLVPWPNFVFLNLITTRWLMHTVYKVWILTFLGTILSLEQIFYTNRCLTWLQSRSCKFDGVWYTPLQHI